MGKKWDWQEQISSDKAVAVFRCIGFSTQERGKFYSFRLQDIPSEGRRNLAYKTRLSDYNFEVWAVLKKVETYRDHYYFTVSVEKAWSKSKTEDWNWKKKSGSSQETAEYTCPGWKCSKEILQKLHNKRLTVSDIPSSVCDSLATIVGLDKNEIRAWSSNFKAWTDEDGIHVSLHVPNTWITANILAFEWDFIGSAAAVGGILGEVGMSAYVNIVSGMKDVRCNNFQSLLSALDRYKGKIWGFTLFAHGSKNGVISTQRRGGTINWQDELLKVIQRHNYKFGRINLMQCYSGFKGKAWIYDDLLNLRTGLQNHPLIQQVNNRRYNNKPDSYSNSELKAIDLIKSKIQNLNIPGAKIESEVWVFHPKTDGDKFKFSYRAKIRAHWNLEWQKLCMKMTSYIGTNVCLVDFH